MAKMEQDGDDDLDHDDNHDDLSAKVVKKNTVFFNYFFQRACRIVLGPPKHALHMVWDAFVIYTAMRTALTVV